MARTLVIVNEHRSVPVKGGEPWQRYDEYTLRAYVVEGEKLTRDVKARRYTNQASPTALLRGEGGGTLGPLKTVTIKASEVLFTAPVEGPV